MRKIFLHAQNPSQVGTGVSFRTSEGSTATGARKAKWREFSTGIAVDQHFKAETLCIPAAVRGTGCGGSGFGDWTSGRGLELTAMKISEQASTTTQRESRKNPARKARDYCYRDPLNLHACRSQDFAFLSVIG